MMTTVKPFLLLFMALAISLAVYSQAPMAKPPKLDEKSLVIDSSGAPLPYVVWNKLLSDGDYTVVFKKGKDIDPDHFLLVKLTEEMKARMRERMKKPSETPYFTVGKGIPNFSMRDLNNKKYKLKELQGKVLVLNFWFVNCPPCRKEIPELNNLVAKYKDNADVVFLAVALDDEQTLQSFLEKTPFNYNIVASGSFDARAYGIKTFPTHVVLDRNSTVVFHTHGYALNTVSWIDKSIQEGLKTQVSVAGSK